MFVLSFSCKFAELHDGFEWKSWRDEDCLINELIQIFVSVAHFKKNKNLGIFKRKKSQTLSFRCCIGE